VIDLSPVLRFFRYNAGMKKEVTKFITACGRRIYCLPVQAFPALVANVFLICQDDRIMLVDCGSGMEESNRDLLAGVAAVNEQFGEKVTLEAVDVIVITHGHIDHFGGLPFVRQLNQTAPIGVHPLDRRVLSNYEERVLVASRRLGIFLDGAGVPPSHREQLMAMYLFAKGVYRSTPVQFLIEEGRPLEKDIDVFHVPGHCPGQLCLQVDDILLTADHVLSRTTPHQAPESITNHMGLSHYLDSLTHVECLPGVSLALGGHEQPMADLAGRVQEIKKAHDERLDKVAAICRQPRTIADVSRELFGHVKSYHVLLALEEAGAHVEYLYQRGELTVANVAELEHSDEPVIEYRRA
jgi:glyoxylase-like metal-dependent hydrolase (beta-lactamase superfamily II)